MKFSSAAMALVLLGCSAAAADDPPVTDWAPDEVVVVTGQGAGPAFWHLKKGDSEIWVLGTVAPMPDKLDWNTTHTAELIDGAREVLMPPSASAGFFEVSWFLITNYGILSRHDGKTLEESLPADLKTRFVAARISAKQDADHYEDDPAILAALKLESDYLKSAGLTGGARDRIEKIARQKHVKVREIAEYNAMGMVKEFLRLPEAAQQACLADAVSDVEHYPVHAVPAAQAWAVGNLPAIKANYMPPSLESCAGKTASFAKLYERAVADSRAAIETALSKPGKTVMLINIGWLLRDQGVAEQLKGEGVLIEGPGG